MEVLMKSNAMKEEEETVELCSDEIYEILTRLSLDTILCQGRWVCKEWRKLTYNGNFRRVHSNRTQSLSGYFIQAIFKNHYHNTFVSFSADQPSHPLDFIPSSPRLPTIHSQGGKFSPPRELKIEASSHHGLLCCVDSSRNHRIPTYYIVKPATREWRQIPNPKTRYFTTNMAMVVRRIKQSDKLHYKILRLSILKSRTRLYCEIFDSNEWSWKQLKDVKLPDSVLLDWRQSVLIHGSFHHWLTKDHHWPTNEDFIFVFDMDAENWTSIALPEQEEEEEEEESAEKKLVGYEGKLGLVKTTKKWVKLWVLEEYFRNRRWKKECCINLEEDENRRCLRYLDDIYSSEIALMRDFGSIVWYDFKRDTSTKTKVPTVYMNAEAYAFDSDHATTLYTKVV